MRDTPETLAGLREVIIGVFPDLAGADFALARRGWDSIAVDVDGRLIFKFPRHDAALGRLRKEAGLLAAIRGQVAMPVPDMALVEVPQVFSRHAKLVGDYLTPAAYAAMSEIGKARVASQLARFYADLHSLDEAELRSRGAGPIGPWLSPEVIAQGAIPHLPAPLRPRAEDAVSAYGAMPPDPLGVSYGFFDGHGWNMAFDPAAERLNGVYDFGDSGFGGLHQEFIYSNLIGFDLTDRIVAAYRALTGRALDAARIDLLTGLHGLSELAGLVETGPTPADLAAGVARVVQWASR